MDWRIQITNNGLRNIKKRLASVRANIHAKRLDRKLNRVRLRAAKDLRYWRATAQTGTIDLGRMNEAEAVERTSKIGPIVNVDWVNAIILYGSTIPTNLGGSNQ